MLDAVFLLVESTHDTIRLFYVTYLQKFKYKQAVMLKQTLITTVPQPERAHCHWSFSGAQSVGNFVSV